jgi:dodecin
MDGRGAGRGQGRYIPRVQFILPPSEQSERKRPLATFKKIEVVGTSSKSVADAIKSAVSSASKSVRNVSWFEVAEIRGAVKGGEVSEFQVTVRLGFKVES